MVSANRFHVPIGIVSLAAPPDAPVVGETYFDTALGQLRSWDGTGWIGTSSDTELDIDFVNVPGDGMTGELVLPDQVTAPPSAPTVVAAKGYVDQLVTVSDVPPTVAPVRDGLIWTVVGTVVGPDWSPASIPGLLAWWDASSLLLVDGEAVTLLPDLSGLGHDLVSNPAVQDGSAPVFKVGGLNGYGVLHYDHTSVLVTETEADYRHFFVVAKYDGATFVDYDGLLSGSSIHLLIGEGLQSTLYLMPVGTIYHKDGILHPGLNLLPGPMEHWASMSISNAAGWGIMGPFRLGIDRTYGTASGYNRYWQGDVAEVIAYDRELNDSERVEVEAYLRQKWAIGAS